MSRGGQTEEYGHVFWWLMEDGELVDWQIEHPDHCYKSERWNGQIVKHAACATDFACECDTPEIFEDLWKGSPDGEHRAGFQSMYRWWVDYYGEADAEFSYRVVSLQ